MWYFQLVLEYWVDLLFAVKFGFNCVSGMLGLGGASVLMAQEMCVVPYCQTLSQQCCLVGINPVAGIFCPDRC